MTHLAWLLFCGNFGPFRWVCTSGKPEDLRTTDQLAASVLKEIAADAPVQIQQQMAPKHMTVPQGHQLANFTRTVNNLPIIGIFSNEVGAPYWQPEAIPGAIDFTRQIPESYTSQNADNLASIPAHHQLMLQVDRHLFRHYIL